MSRHAPSAVLDFWFSPGMESKWFATSESFDMLVCERFFALHKQAKQGELKEWASSREGRLALIILLDQFSRNLYRGNAESFAQDRSALALAKHALQMGDDIWYKANKPDAWRAFLYVVFMHSESMEDQRRCVDLFLTHGPDQNLPFARAHLDVIYRFGRFPNRNSALGRQSTPEELAFLEAGGVSWSK